MALNSTPGPWKLFRTQASAIDIGPDENHLVCRVFKLPSFSPWLPEHAEGNAALIAAAPALLAALEETLRALETHLDEACRDHNIKSRHLLCPCQDNEAHRARAAIARAKGEQ